MTDHDTSAEGHNTSTNPCDVCRNRENAELARARANETKLVRYCTMMSECLNRLRIIPRVIVAAYGYLVWMMVTWFMALGEPSTQQMALVTTISGMAPIVFGFYMQGGVTGQKK